MRKPFYILALAAFALVACKPASHFFVDGKVDGLADGDTLYLVRTGQDTLSSVVDDGRFEFFGTVEYPSSAYISNNLNLREATMREQIFIEKGVIKVTGALATVREQVFTEKGVINVKGKADSLLVSGTPSNDAIRPLTALGDEIVQQFFAAEDEAVRDSLSQAYDRVLEEFVDENLDKYAGFYIFTNLYYDMDPEAAMEKLEAFSEEVKQNPSWEKLYNAAKKKVELAHEAHFIDFEQPCVEDNETMVSLSSVVNTEGNKYVLLDFWASWCGPCMREMPVLKEAYAKYHPLGFEIFGCSFDSEYDSWKGAVEQNGLDWIHVSDLQYWSNAAAGLYGINSIPANFLIDCESGIIIASNLRGDAVLSKLDELL